MEGNHVPKSNGIEWKATKPLKETANKWKATKPLKAMGYEKATGYKWNREEASPY
jgi:hypothetical protein